MKLLLSCCTTSFLIVASSALANSDTRKAPNSLDLGIGYKLYAMNLPSRVSASKNDDTNKFPALALIATDDINEYVSIRFEVAKGLEDASSGYDFSIDAPINPIKIKETYTAELDYSLSVAAKFSLLTNSPIRPSLDKKVALLRSSSVLPAPASAKITLRNSSSSLSHPLVSERPYE